MGSQRLMWTYIKATLYSHCTLISEKYRMTIQKPDTTFFNSEKNCIHFPVIAVLFPASFCSSHQAMALG